MIRYGLKLAKQGDKIWIQFLLRYRASGSRYLPVRGIFRFEVTCSVVDDLSRLQWDLNAGQLYSDFSWF